MSPKRQPTTDAVEILHRLYLENDPDMQKLVEQEQMKLELAQQIYDLRHESELTQEELAARMDMAVEVIQALEETAYEGDYFFMLHKVAQAIGKQIELRAVPLKTAQQLVAP